MTVLISPLKTSGCIGTYSNIASFDHLTKCTLPWKGLAVQLWITKGTIWLMITVLFSATLILGGHQKPTPLAIFDCSSFSDTPFPATATPQVGVEGVSLISFARSDFLVLVRDPSATLSPSSGLFCPRVYVQKTILTPFSIVADYWSHCMLSTTKMTFIEEAWYIHETKL